MPCHQDLLSNAGNQETHWATAFDQRSKRPDGLRPRVAWDMRPFSLGHLCKHEACLRGELELTRERGHLSIGSGQPPMRSPHAEKPTALPARVSSGSG